MNKLLLSALAVLTLAVVAPSPASANNASGSICYVALYPTGHSQYNGMGNEGDLLLILNSQPDCGGSQVAYVYFFTTGATYLSPPAMWLYSGEELRSLFQALVTSRNKPTQRPISLNFASNAIEGYSFSLN